MYQCPVYGIALRTMTTAGENLTFSTGMDENITTSPVGGGGGGGGPPPPGYYREQADNIWTYIPPILMVWGTVGNGLTIVILVRQLRRLSSTAMYLLALGVSDLMILWLGPLRQWTLVLWQVDVRKLTVTGCRVQTFLTYMSVHVSSWLLAAVSMERMTSVVAPHKVRIACTPSRAALVIAAILGCTCALNSHYLWNLDLDVYVPYLDKQFDCIGTTESYRYFVLDVWPWVDFAVAFLVPFTLLAVGNIAIIVKLGHRARNRRMMSHTTPVSSMEREGRNITLMLVMLSVAFVVCMAPVSVYYIYQPYIDVNIRAIEDPLEKWNAVGLYYAFIPAIVNNVAYINASFNFVFYVFSGSKFRNELKVLLRCAAPSDGVFGSSTGGTVTRTLAARTTGATRRASANSTSRATSVTELSTVSEQIPSYDDLWSQT